MKKTSEATVRADWAGPPDRRLAMLDVRMTADRMAEVEVEAARKGISVAYLFETTWKDCVSRRVP